MYDFDLNKNSTAEEIANTIKEYGICRIEGAADITEDLISEAHRFNKQFDNGEYQFGRASRAKIVDIEKIYPELHKLFSQNFMSDCAKEYLNAPFDLNQWVFITHDYKNDGELARNGFLHFDRLYCFKFFYYLTDVDENSGPFSCVPKTHKKGAELRQETHKNEKGYGNLKNRIFLDYPELGYTEEDVVPILGKKGTLMIFDTDLFHLGGVTNGTERLIVRGHTKLK